MGSIDLCEKEHYTFGRLPDMDVVLDHPTSSRLHAVIQFRAEDGAPFLFDPGSTHGTFLNKHRLEGGQYVALRCAGAARRLWVGGCGMEGVTPL